METVTPLVSVIILTFNSEKHIRRCLRSLELQTLPEFEAVVVDNGSSDATESIVRSFDGRFRWTVLAGSDQGAARNHGVRQSRGKYITFLDSDDFYLRDKLKVQTEELDRRSDRQVTFCGLWVYRSGSPLKLGAQRICEHGVLALAHFLEGHNYNLNTMFLRRSIWGGKVAFGEGALGRYGEDRRLQLALAAQGVAMSYVPDSQVVVEIRPDSHTARSRQSLMKQLAMRDVEQAVDAMSQAQRTGLGVPAILDRVRTKLVLAHLLDGEIAEAGVAAAGIRRARLRWLLRVGILLARAAPRAWMRAMVGRAWLARQNRAFRWTPGDGDVVAQMRSLDPSVSAQGGP